MDDEKPAEENAAEKTAKLIARFKEILSAEVKDVKISERLVDSPVCLVAPENDVDMNMHRQLKKAQNFEGRFMPILEINDKHPVIIKLRGMVANGTQDELVNETALLLLDQARIVEGEPLKDPTGFVKRLNRAVEKGLA
jgi:molecular chaperone HtpG